MFLRTLLNSAFGLECEHKTSDAHFIISDHFRHSILLDPILQKYFRTPTTTLGAFISVTPIIQKYLWWSHNKWLIHLRQKVF